MLSVFIRTRLSLSLSLSLSLFVFANVFMCEFGLSGYLNDTISVFFALGRVIADL